MLELVYSSSQRVAFEASRQVWAIDGVKPAEQPNVSVNLEIRAGYVIDLSDGHGDQQHRVASPIIDATPAPADDDER